MQHSVVCEAEIWFNKQDFRYFFTANKTVCGLQGCDGLLVVGVDSLAFAKIKPMCVQHCAGLLPTLPVCVVGMLAWTVEYILHGSQEW